MEVTECTKILLNRIEKFEPQNSTKIIGYLLLNHTHEEIIGYAFGSEKQILSLIQEAKSYLSSPKSVIPPQFASQFPPYSVIPPEFLPNNLSPIALQPNILQAPDLNFNFSQFTPQLLENSQLCHYFSRKGYCKSGNKCRFVHDPNLNLNLNLDFNLGDLGRLEMEIREILISRGHVPVSIALLPMIYLDRYGKVLQSEGYLTESQRHGKSGCSLTKLLARLKSISIIERPHGQHSVVLIEDVHKYTDNRFLQRDLISSSHQIYLTFPSESTFTESEVENYFKQFGPVREVRIPRQERRMFGFVSFVFAETVRLVLTRGHPHYIAGARVLVKPYKEKSKLTTDRQRKGGKTDLSYFCAPNFVDFGLDHFAMPAEYNTAGYLQSRLINERELETRERRLAELHNISNQFTTGASIYPSPDPVQFALDHFSNLKIDIGRENEIGASNSNSENDCGEIDLPESPFA
ncbi:hypothetical protein LUZ60_006359 [Juncus effusus]|nr:hypothetical protein LUZ60_006359 [Juncus effusus]